MFTASTLKGTLRSHCRSVVMGGALSKGATARTILARAPHNCSGALMPSHFPPRNSAPAVAGQSARRHAIPMEVIVKTKNLAALLSAVALLSADTVLAYGGSHRATPLATVTGRRRRNREKRPRSTRPGQRAASIAVGIVARRIWKGW
jgi:hypothetical protein